MYVYRLNRSDKIIADKKTAVAINLLMYGRHGILSLLLQSIKGYLLCAKSGNDKLKECYFEIICFQVNHLITLQNAMGDSAFFLPYESNVWIGFEKNFSTDVCEKKLATESLVKHILLLKKYRSVIKGNINQRLTSILRSIIKQNQASIISLKQKGCIKP